MLDLIAAEIALRCMPLPVAPRIADLEDRVRDLERQLLKKEDENKQLWEIIHGQYPLETDRAIPDGVRSGTVIDAQARFRQRGRT